MTIRILKFFLLFLIVSLNCIGQSDSQQKKWTGSGFGITSDGYIVTNYHVIEDAKSIYVKGINKDFSKKYKAKVILFDIENDLAIIKIDDYSFSSLGTIPYSIRSGQVDVGENIFVLGYPLISFLGDEIKLTNGVLSSQTGYMNDKASYQIQVPIQPGNSGGPLFDNNGKIIGIVNSHFIKGENVSYAIKSIYLEKLINQAKIQPLINKIDLLKGKSLIEQVKQLSNFIYILSINEDIEIPNYSESYAKKGIEFGSEINLNSINALTIEQLKYQQSVIYNLANNAFYKKKYFEACKYFEILEGIIGRIIFLGYSTTFSLESILSNMAISAENGGFYDIAIKYYYKLIHYFPQSKYYNIIYGILKKNGNMDEAKKIVDEGLLKYPTDNDLLISRVNFFIREGKIGEAIYYLKVLVAKDPKNEQVYMALGQAYEKLNDEINAVATYQKLLYINPYSFEGNYGMAAIIFNKAKFFTDKMNALGYSYSDQIKFEELKKKRAGIFWEAKPYLEKALLVKPDNPSVKAALGNIETLTK